MSVPTFVISTLQNISSAIAVITPQSNVGYQPLNDAQIPGFPLLNSDPPMIFQIEGENGVNLRSDITDHYVEDNTSREDHIALPPEEVTVHGFIGELSNITPTPFSPLGPVAARLAILNPFVPGLTVTALNAYNLAIQTYQAISNAKTSIVNALNGLGPNQTKQQAFFTKLYGYWFNRRLFMVQTPWAVFNQMAISGIRAVQDETTESMTDFFVTFKAIRTVASLQGSNPTANGRAAVSEIDLGTSNPSDNPNDILTVAAGVTGIVGAIL